MLVLTRKYQEKVHIGDGITITILRTKGKAVRLGIEAPPEVPVIRGELSFNESPRESVAVAATESSEGATKRVRPPKRQSPRSHTSTGWTSDAHDSKTSPQVSLDRVPRAKAAEVLPRLLSGNAPLRDMLQQRTRAM